MVAAPPLPSTSPDGFLPLPRRFFDGLLAENLTKRELKVLLLVARLTYGCRNTRWARLRQADLAAIGITPNNAGLALKPLLATGVLLQNGTRREYRIAAADPTALTAAQAGRKEHLARLVRDHLSHPSQHERAVSQNKRVEILETRRQIFSNQELPPSQKENGADGCHWQFRAAEGQFVKASEMAINSRKTRINKSHPNHFLNPRTP